MRVSVKLLKAVAEIMLVAVTAFFGYFKHLHIGAEPHIVSRFHSSLGKQGDKILFLMLFARL